MASPIKGVVRKDDSTMCTSIFGVTEQGTHVEGSPTVFSEGRAVVRKAEDIHVHSTFPPGNVSVGSPRTFSIGSQVARMDDQCTGSISVGKCTKASDRTFTT